MKKLNILTLIVVIILFSFCQRNTPQALTPADLKSELKIKPKHIKSDTIETCNVIKNYQLVLPTELLDPQILGKPIFYQLYPTDSVYKLISIADRAFFFGVYMSDLVYSMIYQNQNYFINYYRVIITLSKDLGIKETFTRQYLEKFQENFQTDSAKIIIQDAIVKTCKFLDEAKQINILPYMIVGSWAESIYLILGNAINNQNIPFNIYQLIADQYQTIDKMKAYIEDSKLDVESYNVSLGLNTLSHQLDSLKAVYEKIYISDNIAIDIQSLKTLRNAYNSIKKHYIK